MTALAEVVKAGGGRVDETSVTVVDRRFVALRERTESRTVDATTTSHPTSVWFCAAALLGAAWAATYFAGGTKTALPHAFYVPIILCAIRFGSGGALLVAAVAGALAGPLMPLDVAAGTDQEVGNWLARLAAFVIVGQLTAYLSRRSMPSLTAEIASRRFRNALDAALEGGEITLDYQPIVDLRTGGLAGVEALVRWNSPVHGARAPDQFVREAERCGVVGALTRYVIGEACRQLGEWRSSSAVAMPTFKLAVNVSAADIVDDGLPFYIGGVLAATDLPNDWLHLEVTETAVVHDVDAVVNGLMELRMVGVRLAIDDFGTGESSLNYLQRFPIDVVKIDRSFVSRIEHQGQGDAVVTGIIAMAGAMGLSTVAEGVETPVQARSVRDAGSTWGQGYLFSRPVSPAVIGELLREPEQFRQTNLAYLQPS